MAELIEILKKYWGYDAFRPLQQEIIDSVLGKNDTLALMPTGGGKSLCFQIPALAGEGLCLVISPLIALMKDQVSNLKKRGIPALSIHSGMRFIEVKKTLENALYGNFKFLYVSPERLETDFFLEYLPSLKINLIAVDEAHCISQWGYDFRPPYLRIASIREHFPDVPLLALTASATLEVQNDICEKLLFKKDYKAFHQSFERPNLSFSAFELSSRQNKLLEILRKVPGSGIVYCKSRRRTKEIAELLQMNNISADFYHAGLSNEERNKKQEDWINNKKRIIACTNAFGMGIDKPDVRTVIHYDMPDALENYYQEAGRAGRDSKKSYAVLFYNNAEIEELKKQPDIKFPKPDVIRKVYGALCDFLQLPSGSGEGMSCDFDISVFVKNFKLDAYTVNSVLKVLEQENLLTYSEQFFSPSIVFFTTDKSTLNSFEQNYPQLDLVVKALLRSYDGIFDFPCAINEQQLAKFTHITKERLIKILYELSSMGIIDFTPQTESPQIYFLQNRVKSADLMINQKDILKRKESYKKRLEAMISFAITKRPCRSATIANYFNDYSVNRCGVCDNCLTSNRVHLTNAEFEAVSAGIKKYSKEKQLSPEDIFKRLSSFPKNKIWKVLIYLQEENIISIDSEGFIKSK